MDTAPGAPARHVPVLLERIVDLLAPALDHAGAVLVDATLGHAGHTRAVLQTCPRARVIGLDRDPAALQGAREGLGDLAGRVTFVHTVYDQMSEALGAHGSPRVDAVLFDLGVSSMQLDEHERGFSYAHDAPLDMRMDPTVGRTAADVLAEADERELSRILRQYGEERFARRIAAAVVRTRASVPLTTSRQLVELIRGAVPAAARRTGGHPAKRTFQALRIEVNDELSALRRALPQAVSAIAVGGRLVVLSYHSLEDRMVKQELARHTQAGAPAGLPVVPEHLLPRLRSLTRGAEKADDHEVADNPRARSVRLRAAERIREAA
ncbi:MAG: 16S rRNA (cytosine(1402)-N(4))-methyltransferase RsmH [Actinomycetota bacterium]|nr:16S rRNA (cytosine(1402)-N(4))-methyltransferase RsmH [Actinomycetota bacterium]